MSYPGLTKEKLIEKKEAMKQAAIEFANGSPIKEVMVKYQVSYASVYNALKRYDIPYKKTYGRKNFFNENYFHIIDTEHKAYWLGFIMADGYVTKTGARSGAYDRLGIGIKETDIEILEKFSKDIEFTGYFIKDSSVGTYGKKAPLSVIHLNSKTICDDLISHGCYPNKTGYSSMPSIQSDLIPHFIRGYFDGDGSISVYEQRDHRNPKYIRMKQEFQICSDYQMVSEIQSILMQECNLPETKIKQEKNSACVRYGGKQQVLRIFHYLYNDASIFLQRKYDKFSLLLS